MPTTTFTFLSIDEITNVPFAARTEYARRFGPDVRPDGIDKMIELASERGIDAYEEILEGFGVHGIDASKENRETLLATVKDEQRRRRTAAERVLADRIAGSLLRTCEKNSRLRLDERDGCLHLFIRSLDHAGNPEISSFRSSTDDDINESNREALIENDEWCKVAVIRFRCDFCEIIASVSSNYINSTRWDAGVYAESVRVWGEGRYIEQAISDAAKRCVAAVRRLVPKGVTADRVRANQAYAFAEAKKRKAEMFGDLANFDSSRDMPQYTYTPSKHSASTREGVAVALVTLRDGGGAVDVGVSHLTPDEATSLLAFLKTLRTGDDK